MRFLLTGRRAAYVGGIAAATAAGAAGAIVLATRARQRRLRLASWPTATEGLGRLGRKLGAGRSGAMLPLGVLGGRSPDESARRASIWSGRHDGAAPTRRPSGVLGGRSPPS